MALLGRRLSERMRRALGGRGSVVRPVLGFGGAASVLAGGHPSDGVSPAHRGLWERWKRRGRARGLRSLLLRGHGVDEAREFGEADEERARANAGSDTHNPDAAPYLARQRCRGGRASPREHLWGRSPFRCPARGAEGARRADRSGHTGGLPRFGPRWTRKTLLLLSCIELGSSGAWGASCTERMAVWMPELRTLGTFPEPNPLYVAHGPPFIAQRGHRQVS